MARYLLHQARSGEVLGVWFENDSAYVPTLQGDRAQTYGQAVMDSRGPATEWDDYAEQLASKSPAPNYMWDQFSHYSSVLSEVLAGARQATEKPETGEDE